MIELISMGILLVLLIILIDIVIYWLDYDKYNHNWRDIIPGSAIYRRLSNKV